MNTSITNKVRSAGVKPRTQMPTGPAVPKASKAETPAFASAPKVTQLVDGGKLTSLKIARPTASANVAPRSPEDFNTAFRFLIDEQGWEAADAALLAARISSGRDGGGAAFRTIYTHLKEEGVESGAIALVASQAAMGGTGSAESFLQVHSLLGATEIAEGDALTAASWAATGGTGAGEAFKSIFENQRSEMPDGDIVAHAYSAAVAVSERSLLLR